MRYFKQVIQSNTIYWELMGEGKDWQLNLKRTGEMLCGTDLLEKYLGMVKYLVNSKVVQLPEYVSKNLVYEETPDVVRMYLENVKMNYIPVGEAIICESFIEKGEKVFESTCNFIYMDIRYLRSVVDEYYDRHGEGESCDVVYSMAFTGECSEVKDCGLVYTKDGVEIKVAPDNSFALMKSIDMIDYVFVGKKNFQVIDKTSILYSLFLRSKYVEDLIYEVVTDSGVKLYFERKHMESMEIEFIGNSLEGVE